MEKVNQENCLWKGQNKVTRDNNSLLFNKGQGILTVACREKLTGSDLIIQHMRLQNAAFTMSHKMKTNHLMTFVQSLSLYHDIVITISNTDTSLLGEEDVCYCFNSESL